MLNRRILLGCPSLPWLAALSSAPAKSSSDILFGDALKEFERHFKSVVDGLAGPYSQTGEPYIVVTNSGLKEEGEMSGTCVSKREAVTSWLSHVSKLAASGSAATLYWREKPVLSCQTYAATGTEEWMVYSRFLISEREISAAAIEKHNLTRSSLHLLNSI